MTVLNSPPPRGASVIERKEGEPVRAFTQPWSGWFRNLYNVLHPGKTEDVVVGGVTLHFVNGIYTGQS